MDTACINPFGCATVEEFDAALENEIDEAYDDLVEAMHKQGIARDCMTIISFAMQVLREFADGFEGFADRAVRCGDDEKAIECLQREFLVRKMKLDGALLALKSAHYEIRDLLEGECLLA